MAEERVQRRLAAILAADVAGYSRLMGADEEGTLAALTAHRYELIEPCIAEHRGRIVKTTGDGLLAEFASVVDAMRCAVAFQEGIAARNANVPDGRRLEFRIGVNLGDVIVQDDDVYGDGVNVAARLEGLAMPGRIVVSGSVHEQVKGKLDMGFDDLGPQSVKNIAEPVRAYRVHAGTEAEAEVPETGVLLPLPDKPSIAVLPFENMSGDPDQQYFSDGISEDIITDLSKRPGLFVIARNSTFVYRGRTVNVSDVSRALGVRYVLEGSVRKAGNRVRVTAQLIDGTTGGHLWAERYDRDLTDIFAVQDELTEEIVVALALTLSDDEGTRVARSTTEDMEAYDCFLRGRELILRQSRDATAQAIPVLERAIDLAPGFAPAYAMLAGGLIREYINDWVDRPQAALERAYALAEQSITLDTTLPHGHWIFGYALLWKRKHVAAARAVEQAVELDANFADARAGLAQIYTYAGQAANAVGEIELAMRLDPHYRDVFLHFLGMARFMQGDFEAAAGALRRRLLRRPGSDITLVALAASYGHLGRRGEARAVWEEALRINPNYSLDQRRRVLPFKDPADFDRIVEGLHKAGLP